MTHKTGESPPKPHVLEGLGIALAGFSVVALVLSAVDHGDGWLMIPTIAGFWLWLQFRLRRQAALRAYSIHRAFGLPEKEVLSLLGLSEEQMTRVLIDPKAMTALSQSIQESATGLESYLAEQRKRSSDTANVVS